MTLSAETGPKLHTCPYSMKIVSHFLLAWLGSTLGMQIEFKEVNHEVQIRNCIT
jgi:hypothetical protein